MRTTLTLDDDVAFKLKAEARRTGRPLKVVVNDTLRLGLVAASESKPIEPFVVRARPMGARPGLNFDKISELIEQVEGPYHK